MGGQLGNLGSCALQSAVHEFSGACCVAHQLLGARVDERGRVREGGAGAQLFQPVDFVVDEPGDSQTDAGSGLLNARQLLSHIGDHPLRSVGWRGCAQIGNIVEQRLVCLVPDRADHGGGTRRHRPHESLVAKYEQILEVAATPGNDDDIHLRVSVQLLHCRCHFS